MTTNPETAGVERTDAELLRLIAKDHQRLAPNAYHTAECLREIAARIESHLPAAREDGEAELWRHKKRGTVYKKIGVAELQCATGQNPGEGEGLVIYRGEDGKLWARMADEFHDGRFELATTRPAPEQAPEPKCFECGDSGEVFGHADDCDNDSCALNGDIDSCLGKVEPCGCAPLAPDHANCAVGEGEHTPEPTPQQGLGEILKAAVASMTPEQKSALADGYVVDAKTMAALNAMSVAIRAETTAQIVAWLRAKAAERMALKEEAHDYVTALLDAADVLSRGAHLTGGGE